MSGWQFVSSPIGLALFVVAFIGSLFARRGIADRVWFTLVMPVVFGMVWFVSLIAIAPVIFLLFPNGPSWIDAAAFTVATMITLVAFVVLVVSMSKDTRGSTVGYSLGRRTSRSPLRRETTRLDKIPTRRTWGG